MATYGTAIKFNSAINLSNTGNPSSLSYAPPTGCYGLVNVFGFTTNNTVGSLTNLIYAAINFGGIYSHYAAGGGIATDILCYGSNINGGLGASYNGSRVTFVGVSAGSPLYVPFGITLTVSLEFTGGGIESVFIEGTQFSNG